jgi:hypothetical protein
MLNMRPGRAVISLLIVGALLTAANMCGLTNAFGATPEPHDCCKKEPVQKKFCCTELHSNEAIATKAAAPEAAEGAILVASALAPRSYCDIHKGGASDGPPGDEGDTPASELHDFTERTLHSPPVLS